ncbi:MAG: hypothetical protein LLG14_12665 [Nocardiaceae bacterium]|nr:hypothetical protein [Nocardiaceae bacterium]
MTENVAVNDDAAAGDSARKPWDEAWAQRFVEAHAEALARAEAAARVPD